MLVYTFMGSCCDAKKKRGLTVMTIPVSVRHDEEHR
jgi:hypothetical protein